MQNLTAESTSGPKAPSLAAEAAQAAEAQLIGYLARQKAEAENAAETEALVAADGRNRYGAIDLARVASWATSKAFQAKAFQGDWHGCQGHLILKALEKAAEAAPKAADLAAQEKAEAEARRSCKARQTFYSAQACKALAEALAAEAEAADLACPCGPDCTEVAEAIEGGVKALTKARRQAKARRQEAARLHNLAARQVAEAKAPEALILPSVAQVNPSWFYAEALTWVNVQAKEIPEAPENVKGQARQAADRSKVTAEDLAEAYQALTGQEAPKIVKAWLYWAMSQKAATRGTGRTTDGLSKAEACILAGLPEAQNKNVKRGAKAIQAIGVTELVAEAEGLAVAEAADLTPSHRAQVWFTQAARRQAIGTQTARGRQVLTVERNVAPVLPIWDTEARTWRPAARVAPVALVSYREAGPIRRRPLILARVTWQAARTKARRQAQARRLTRQVRSGAEGFTRLPGGARLLIGGQVKAYRPDAAATIAAPKVYAMPTPIGQAPAKAHPKAPKAKAAQVAAQARQKGQEAAKARTEAARASMARHQAEAAPPMGRTEKPMSTKAAKLRGIGRPGRPAPSPKARQAAEALAPKVARHLADAHLIAALAERPRRTKGAPQGLACPLTARPGRPLTHKGAWGEPMTRPEGLTARW